MLGWREFNDGKGSQIGIYGSNCPQWIVAMEACSAHSLICVPLYDTLRPGAVNFIIGHAEIDFVFVQDKKVKGILNPECTHAKWLKLIICFTSLAEEVKKKVASIEIKSYSWNEFQHMGKEHPSELLPPQPFNICTIMYTSGTSGDPKGVILTHENIALNIRGVDLFLGQFEDKMTADDVYISFLPLAHVLDRMIEEYFFRKGASVGYYHGDINELRDDLMELRPTFLAGVPRVFERIHEGVIKALEELNPVRRRAFDILYQYKLAWMNLGFKHKNASWLADLLAFRKVKARLGGRIRLIVSGAAPLSSEVEEFLRVTSCAYVVQGYGLTETCGLATIGFPDEMCMIGTIGSPFVYSELRLEEVPEMGYNPLGDPSCGEICVRGKTTFTGYNKNPELTAEAFKDGWFYTDDMGEMLTNGVVKITDRKKNLIKLSQGEHVAVECLEKFYGITPIVEDIWVYGDSFRSMLVAVVVPHEENTIRRAYQNGHRGSLSELCFLKQLQDNVLLQLKSKAERTKLRGFEYIKGIILEPLPFDAERDLVTATLKKKREKLHKYYKVKIDELYQKLSAGRR
ncbi:long chain acyl-CoA synthetase 1-like [Camellia sinensis]|uniref:long chain acyl-CoA synthetase 1-like n=1 Tax=Camellia sinensis TaxID=4442 RepID=UPI001036026D|nr:long chain acyl-CoA synthetase 1-like [Camellia sinensis]